MNTIPLTDGRYIEIDEKNNGRIIDPATNTSGGGVDGTTSHTQSVGRYAAKGEDSVSSETEECKSCTRLHAELAELNKNYAALVYAVT